MEINIGSKKPHCICGSGVYTESWSALVGLYYENVQGGPNILHTFCAPYNFIKFWAIFKLFPLSESQGFCNNTITKDLTIGLPQMYRYTTLWNVNNWKQDFSNNTF